MTPEEATPHQGSQPSQEQPPVFDYTGLLHRLMDDEDLAQAVIAAFLEDIPIQIQKLKDCLQAGDVKGTERQAHTIKGASANVGGDALRAVALEMEKSARSADLPAVQLRMVDLDAQFERLSMVFANLNSNNNHQ